MKKITNPLGKIIGIGLLVFLAGILANNKTIAYSGVTILLIIPALLLVTILLILLGSVSLPNFTSWARIIRK